MKKRSSKQIDRCPVVASGGALTCALKLGHNGPHSTTNSAPRKVMQHATWIAGADGRVAVTTYTRGKKQSGWMEEAPPTQRPMTLEDEPDDPEAEEAGLAAIEAEEREASLADACKKCGRELGEHDGKKCPKPHKAKSTAAKCEAIALSDDEWVCVLRPGHPGPHSSERVHGGTMATWTTNDDGSEKGERRAVNHAGKVLGVTAVGSGGWSLPARDIEAEVAQEFEDDVQKEIANPSRAEERFSAGGGVSLSELLAAREVKRRRKEEKTAKKAKPSELSPAPVVALTRIGSHEVHPAAALFPMIEGEEREAFRADIKANGLRKKIVVIDESGSLLILDGRNRLRACLDLGIEPRFRTFGEESGDGTDPIAFVVSENVQRRHLNETQRAFVGAELVPMYEAQAKERQRLGGERKGKLNVAEAQKGTATEHAARAVNVSSASIKHALTVKRDGAPEVLSAARERGQIKVSTAAELVKLPQHKQQEIVQKLGGGELRSGKVRAYVNQEKKRDVVRKINERRVAPMPGGLFGVIYGDYPWHYDNSDQHEGSRGHLGYPTMKMEEVIAHALEAAKRAAGDCIVALWSTNLYITRMDRVIEAFGAERRTVFTWPKPKFGVGTWGRGQTEHLVVASIGSPVHTLNEVSTLLPSWKPAHPDEHSSKPAEVAQLLAKHCGGPFLELFSREERKGWASWGAETGKFATEAA